jgi:hypothetical protein
MEQNPANRIGRAITEPGVAAGPSDSASLSLMDNFSLHSNYRR